MAANARPNTPTLVKIDGKDEADALITKSTGQVIVSAIVSDPNSARVRLVVQYSKRKDFGTSLRTHSILVDSGQRAVLTLSRLAQDTRYYIRCYARDGANLLSASYNSANFWTNRKPSEPDLITPAENSQIPVTNPIGFSWRNKDIDDPTAPFQKSWRLQYRVASTATTPSGDWVTVGPVKQAARFTGPTSGNAWTSTWLCPANTFATNTYYEWKVATQDYQSAWGPYNLVPFSFFITGVSTAPIPLQPTADSAVDVTEDTLFAWKFRDPQGGDSQIRADLRWRPVSTSDLPWTTTFGTTTVPGDDHQWLIPAETFTAGVHYEWQVRTYDLLASAASSWSASARFWSIRSPGEGTTGEVVPMFIEVGETLGCGTHRVFIYEKGGTQIRGEITPLSHITWNRKRDDISNTLVTTNGFGSDCCELLAGLRSWMHEVVVFRDGVRVWEGPITRITYTPDSVEIEAKDVMAYVYRKILRQGFNDSSHWVTAKGKPLRRWQAGAIQLGLHTVVERAERITMNALAPDDPNVLAYLTSIKFPDDAVQSRVVPDFSSTAWEQIDDMAATAGLDYVTVGRRIVYWDTHRYIGILPEMRDEHFSDPPVVTEYGMQLATDFGVTNNAGVWGEANRSHQYYGVVEQLASAYGEAEGGAVEVLTEKARRDLEASLDRQAERNIAHRYPTPLVVRVPDNSTIHPDTPLGINQLVPGVWLPLRSRGTCRDVAQWQKLDLVTVEQDSTGEKVTVTMQPAPDGGTDPDIDAVAEES